MANPKKIRTVSSGGLSRPAVTVGPADPVKARIAKRAMGAGGFGMRTGSGREREAGMLIDTSQVAAPYSTGYKLEAYRTSYAYGLSDRTGAYDIPTYFVQMNEQNGGMLYWPVTLAEKMSWYRYWIRTDSYIGRAMELLSDLPMSKLTLNMLKPVGKLTKELGSEILAFFEYQMQVIDLFELCQNILWEVNGLGNCFPADHLVHTDLGMTPICQIRRGDSVLAANGKRHVVSEISRRYVSEWLVDFDISRLTALDFTPTSEHPVLVFRGGKEEMVKARDVRVGDYVGIAFDNTVEDVAIKDVASEIGGILDGRYDKVSVSSGKDLVVSVEYISPIGVSFVAEEIKDKILSWMMTLGEAVEMTCEELGQILGVSDTVKLRSVAYLLRKRGVISTERIGAGRQGSSIRWFPLLEKPDMSDFYGTDRKKEFSSKFKSLNIDEDFLYLLGYWLGDGWLWEYKRPASYEYLAFDICAQRGTPQCEKLIDVMTSVFGGGNFSSGSSPVFAEGEHMFHVSVEDPILCAWWGHYFGSNCENKKLPCWVMDLPPEKQIWILKGMIDSDGFVSSNDDGSIVAGMVNTNLGLMHQLFQIGIRCGIPFCFERQVSHDITLPGDHGRIRNSKPMFTLKTTDNATIRGLISECVKSVPVANENNTKHVTYLCQDGKYYFRVANTGRKFHEGFVYNIEVEEDHTYCVNQIRTHNCFLYHEWDEKKKMWSRAVMLPQEEVYIFQYPFTDNKRVEYRPQRLISLIKAQGGDEASELPKGDYDRSAMNEKIVEGVPKEIVDMVRKEGCIVMDTDPMTGSFVHHIARRRHMYHDLGASVLERVLVPMLQKEHYRYTQLSLASRNMTPKNLITAPGLMPDEVDELRTQVDLSFMDPEYSVITNYEVHWELIGVQERLLDFSREYEQIENQVFAAMGVTRELLTGEGQFSGTKITVEIMNTMFLLSREVLRNYIEKQLFVPICEAHGWFEEDKNGAKKYWYPQIGFNRLTIRDNAEVFDSLFQLYSKGSLPVEVIYELFNLNADEMNAKLLAGLFTTKDSTFNRMLEEVNTEVGRVLPQQTDIVEKVSKYLGLEYHEKPEEGGVGGEGGDGFQQGYQEPQTDGATVPEDQGRDAQEGQSEGGTADPEAVAKEVAESLPPNASDQDIQEAVDEVDKAHGDGKSITQG